MTRRRRLQVRDLQDVEFMEDEVHHQNHVNIAFVPEAGDSSDSDASDYADSNEVCSSTFLPYGSFEQVISSYNNTQKTLEPDHEYLWKEGSHIITLKRQTIIFCMKMLSRDSNT